MIDLDALKQDRASFLSMGIEDDTLYKLETYRLYKAGYSVTDIAHAFGFARPYLYELWRKLENEGVKSLIKKNWGTASRKRTPETEAAIIRAKALNPQKTDSELATEFDTHPSTVYRILKEHGIQDLHRVD